MSTHEWAIDESTLRGDSRLRRWVCGRCGFKALFLEGVRPSPNDISLTGGSCDETIVREIQKS
ncbi:MAG: hypothetical protein BWY99_00396 [Synergistetes bacterium ADurb.BinA166]|nr:MAG: hypothetical protein BWY99_00396 [Synergistetes bacterium ADurb.BinA166]